jgi:glycosyltransferase involved in cell wall biosynthesis
MISCILATRNRPQFAAQAIRLFEDQTCRRAELIVIDDGDAPIRELCLDHRRVRYIRLPVPTSTGTKLNIGIASAAGDILQKFDDDDYYHPRFLETALAHLPKKNRDRSIVAWDCFLAVEKGDPQVRFSGHGWKVGATLCFTRALWERHPFRDVPRSVDSWFLKDHGRAKVIRVCAADYFMVVRHGRNTWTHFSDGQRVEDYFRKLARDPRPVERIVSRRHAEFYRKLAAGRRIARA